MSTGNTVAAADIHHDSRPQPAQLCVRCSAASRSRCKGCSTVWYCGRECQLKDWQLGHKVRCKQIKLNNEAAASTASAVGAGSSGAPPSTRAAAAAVAALPLPRRWLFPPQQLQALYKETALDVPYGLVNPSCSCYINCVLVCLFSTAPLQSYLRAQLHRPNCTLSPKQQFCATCIMEDLCMQATSTARCAFLPRQLLLSLRSIHPDYSISQQEDAVEFYHSLMQSMQKAMLREDSGDTAGYQSNVRTQETTLLYQLFGGTLQSQISCPQCSYSSLTHETVTNLAVELTDAVDTLSDALEAFCSPQRLDKANTYKCDGCQTSVKAIKRIQIVQAPNVLLVQLKRFRSASLWGKNNKYISFPLELSLAPYMSSSSSSCTGDTGGSSARYALYAVIVHLDMMSSSAFGHYVAYTFNPVNQRWYRYDDEVVSEVSVEEVLRSRAYCLLYRRRTPFIARAEVDTRPETVDNSQPKLCLTGCGFYAGSKEQDGLCSVCYKRQQQPSSPSPEPSAGLPSSLLQTLQRLPASMPQRLNLLQAFRNRQQESSMQHEPHLPADTEKAELRSAELMDQKEPDGSHAKRHAANKLTSSTQLDDTHEFVDSQSVESVPLHLLATQPASQLPAASVETVEMRNRAKVDRMLNAVQPDAEAVAEPSLASEMDASFAHLSVATPTYPATSAAARSVPVAGKHQPIAAHPTTANLAGGTRAGKKVQPNEPCPCGSSRKFKRCHGAA